mgnify:CR=1 FL=1
MTDGSSTEVYDGASGEFAAVGPMAFDHGMGFSATRLADGRVLILGGVSAPHAAEIFDPVAQTFTEVQAGTLEARTRRRARGDRGL